MVVRCHKKHRYFDGLKVSKVRFVWDSQQFPGKMGIESFKQISRRKQRKCFGSSSSWIHVVNLVSSINILGVMGSSIKLQFLWVCRSPAQNIYYRLLYIASYINYSDYSYSCLMLFNHWSLLPIHSIQLWSFTIYSYLLIGFICWVWPWSNFLDFMRFLNVNPMLETLRFGIAQMSSKKKVLFYWPDSMDDFFTWIHQQKMGVIQKMGHKNPGK